MIQTQALCQMFVKWGKIKNSKAFGRIRKVSLFRRIAKIILVIFVIIWYIVPAEGCRDTVDGCPLRREVIQCT